MRYRVLVPEFRFEGGVYGPGDHIVAQDTNEILTNVAIGRLIRDDAADGRPEEPRPGVLPGPPAAEPSPQPSRLFTAPVEDAPPRRRYTRRDLTSE